MQAQRNQTHEHRIVAGVYTRFYPINPHIISHFSLNYYLPYTQELYPPMVPLSTPAYARARAVTVQRNSITIGANNKKKKKTFSTCNTWFMFKELQDHKPWITLKLFSLLSRSKFSIVKLKHHSHARSRHIMYRSRVNTLELSSVPWHSNTTIPMRSGGSTKLTCCVLYERNLTAYTCSRTHTRHSEFVVKVSAPFVFT